MREYNSGMAHVKRGWLPAVLIILVIACLQGWLINRTFMREDEEIAFRTTSRDLSYAIGYQAAADVQAPAWFGGFWLWQQVAGKGEFAGRWLGLLTTLITLAYVYRLCVAWFQNPRFGWFALILLGSGAYFTVHAMEIRPYPLILLLATYSTYCLWRWLSRRSWRAAMLYGLSIALSLYVHYFLAFLILGHAIYVLVMGRRYWAQFAGAGLLAGVLWSPWSVVFVGQLQLLRQVESAAGSTRGLIGIGNTTEPSSLEAVIELANRMTNGLPGLYGVLLLISLIYGWRMRSWWLALTWGVGVPLIALVANLVVSVYTQRYVSYLSIGFAILVAFGLARLPRWSPWPILIVVAGFSLWMLPGQLPQDRIPFRDLFRQVSVAAQPGDALYLMPPTPSDNLLNWHLRAYLRDDLRANRLDTIEAASAARRVWFVTPDWFNEDVQAAFKRLELTHPLQQVFGRCDRAWCYLLQLMEAPPLMEPVLFGGDMAFWGMDVDMVSPQMLRTRLWWRVEQVPSANYSFSLRLVDDAGAVLAQNDGPINHYGRGIVETATLQPGQIYIDWRQLEFVNPLGPGTYPLQLVVYDWQSGERLRVPDGADALTVQSVTIAAP